MGITPTTWNPSDISAGLPLSNGNLTVGIDSSGSWKAVRAIFPCVDGLYYWEINLAMNYDWPFFAGVATADADLDAYPEDSLEVWMAGMDLLVHGGSVGAGPNGANGVLRFALNKTDGKLWIAKDAGAWYGGGDPEAGTSPTFSGITGTIFPIIYKWCYNVTDRPTTADFGATAFTYAAPSGYEEGYGEDTNVIISGVNLSAIASMSASVPLIPPVILEALAGLSVGSVGADYVLVAGALQVTSGLTIDGVLIFVEGSSRITYELVLTGDADGLSDLTVPISSFQARLRSGDPSFLSVVVPGTAHDAEINARSNGDLVIYMVKTLDSGNIIREEIARATLETIRLDEGEISQSVTLSGHKTLTFSNKAVSLSGGSYKAVTNGMLRYRCSPHIYLKPGDTVTVDGSTFIADSITISISVDQQTMEVAEEGA